MQWKISSETEVSKLRNKAERAERAERAQIDLDRDVQEVTEIDLDRDVQEVTEIGRKAEADYKIFKGYRRLLRHLRAEADYEIFKSTREKACPKRCGGVMWLIDGRLICGSCRAEG